MELKTLYNIKIYIFQIAQELNRIIKQPNQEENESAGNDIYLKVRKISIIK